MSKAIVLLSGGLDSTTVLAIAKEQKFDCYALSFDYGQKQRSELDSAKAIAKKSMVSEHRIMKISLADIGGSALTDDKIDVPKYSDKEEIPITYVPARNTIFLSFALAWAEVIDCQKIFIGVNALDYSGYPDCRPEYIKAYEDMANLATKQSVEGEKMTIETGKLQYTITSFVQTKTIYTYTIFKTSNPSGTRFTRTISVPAASSASIPAVKTGTFNFDGYTFDLTGNDGTKFNTFESEVTVNTDPNGGTVSVSNLDSVFIENRLLSLKPAYVEGYIGQSSFIEGPTVNNFSVFDQIISGTLDIDSIDIFTEIKNYVGAEARIKLRQLISNNSRTGNNVPLIHSSINNWITLNRGVDNNGLVSPSINRVFYTKANSNIDRVIENLSDQMTTELEAQVNPLGNIGSGNDFLYFDQVIEADFHIRLPLKFIAKDLKLRQKIDLNLTDDSNPVNNALVTIYAENGFPFDAEIQLFLLNSGGAIIDSVMVQGLIRSANTDALNIVTNPVNSILEAVIPTDKMTIINNNSEVILQIIFNTNNSPHTTIYRDNYIKFKLVTDMNMEIKYN